MLRSPVCGFQLCAPPSDWSAAFPQTQCWTSAAPSASETPPDLQASSLREGEERRGVHERNFLRTHTHSVDLENISVYYHVIIGFGLKLNGVHFTCAAVAV